MAVLKRRDLERVLGRPDADCRLLLLAGPDEAASRAAAAVALRLLADPDDPLSVVELAADGLRADPGRLADEAAAVSMFGGRRAIRVRGAGEAAHEAVRLLLAAPVAGNPVVMTAGELSRDSALRKLAEGSPLALVLISYPLEGRELARWLRDEAAACGLRLDAEVASRLLATADDIGILSAELEKYALCLDATPDEPKRLDSGTVQALGAGGAEEDTGALVSALVAGDPAALEQQLALFEQSSAIPALRAVARRLLQMAGARAAVDAGADARAAVRALRPPLYPFREQDVVVAALPRWPLPRIRAGLARLLAAERRIKLPGSPGDRTGWQAILDLGAPVRRH